MSVLEYLIYIGVGRGRQDHGRSERTIVRIGFVGNLCPILSTERGSKDDAFLRFEAEQTADSIGADGQEIEGNPTRPPLRGGERFGDTDEVGTDVGVEGGIFHLRITRFDSSNHGHIGGGISVGVGVGTSGCRIL